jgi:hypothetical protein
MKKFMQLLTGCLLVSAVFYAPLSPAAAAPATSPALVPNTDAGKGTETESQLLGTLLNALQNSDYQKFIATGTSDFAKLDQTRFQGVAGQLAPRLKNGYEATRLGDYHQQGYLFSLWKLSFKDGGDDLIGTLNILNGQVGGFVLR